MKNSIKLSVLILTVSFLFLGCKKKEKEKEVVMNDVVANGSALLKKGTLSDGDPSHKSSGVVEVYQTSGNKTLQFKTFNGSIQPDVRVYLSESPTNITNATELGPVKATTGSFNYTFDDSINLSTRKYVVLWCKQFSVLFGKAELINP
jgi:Electron transfer DM13